MIKRKNIINDTNDDFVFIIESKNAKIDTINKKNSFSDVIVAFSCFVFISSVLFYFVHNSLMAQENRSNYSILNKSIINVEENELKKNQELSKTVETLKTISLFGDKK